MENRPESVIERQKKNNCRGIFIIRNSILLSALSRPMAAIHQQVKNPKERSILFLSLRNIYYYN
jgi:hypothetical protein